MFKEFNFEEPTNDKKRDEEAPISPVPEKFELPPLSEEQKKELREAMARAKKENK